MKKSGFLRLMQGAAPIALLASPAMAAEVEVMHWWTSGGEQAAVTVFAEEFNASGEDTWVDTAVAGGPQARAAVMQRTLGGDPPDAAQFNPGRQYEELIDAGLLLDLTELAEAEGWADVVQPSAIFDPCVKDGRVWCVPVNVHSWQWGWASLPVFEQSGVDVPTTLNAFLEIAPQIQEAGFIPFAIGGESWQHSGALQVVLLSQIGSEGYMRLYRDRDTDYARGPEVAAALQVWRDLTSYVDEGAGNRNWNDTTNLVITDQAALQIMGDWARGEFALAGEVPGEDYACLPGGPSEHPYLDTGGDIFLFPKQDDPEVEAAQLRLASLMISPRVQTLFNLAKGSLPVRGDVDLSLADDCMMRGLELLADADNVVPAMNNFFTEDTTGQFNDLWAEFSFNRDLSIEEAQERLAEIIETAG
ncbi:MAG: ABC transporter substrate-binding protein [Alphaproteobacteria bacterium]